MNDKLSKNDFGKVRVLGTVGAPKGMESEVFMGCESNWVVAHSEGRLWKELLKIFLFEQLGDKGCMDVQGRSFLSGPADLLPQQYILCIDNTLPPPLSSFYSQRKHSIERRLSQISGWDIDTLRAEFNNSFKSCKENKWLEDWTLEDFYRMEDLAACLGGLRLATALRAMVMEPESYMRGQPDLLFWKARKLSIDTRHPIPKTTGFSSRQLAETAGYRVKSEEPANCYETLEQRDTWLSDTDLEMGKYRTKTGPWTYDNVFAVEVKSQKDLMSPWQLLWANLCNRADIPFEMCKIESQF